MSIDKNKECHSELVSESNLFLDPEINSGRQKNHRKLTKRRDDEQNRF